MEVLILLPILKTIKSLMKLLNWEEVCKILTNVYGGVGMEIRVLRYFLTVAREENITKSAEKLHITQPTLSRQLKQLETIQYLCVRDLA